jgi:hypothetical protein
MTTIIAWILFGSVVVILIAWIMSDLAARLYRAGYVRGMEDSGRRYAEWEARADQQVEQVREEIRREEAP